ncbi:MAG TPA: NUDIX pyrophosphatase [Ktedonobacteraceae bacterium]|nr:NUDIX pyrophosphatase [Ktedonobacteraceae bacterium]
MPEPSEEKVQSPPRPTPVVTCFLLRNDGPAPRLLLVRRSQRVGSYNTRWAGVSGFIEEGVSPEEQAYTEIREETGLQRSQVRLLKRGAVVEHIDEQLGRRWLVHPFLVETLDPVAITLDWEAVDMRWIAPDELSSYETVPKLKEAFASAEQGEAI